MQITKYPITNSKLNMIAEFVWHLTSETGISDGRLLPIINTDLIINLSSAITYRFIDSIDVQAPQMHIRYVKLKHQIINQAAPINVWGVSLCPFGVYPLLRTNMSTMEECLIDLQQINSNYTSTIMDKLIQINENSEGSIIIENALLNLIGNYINVYEIELLDYFIRNINGLKVGEYCKRNGICIRSLERLTKKYTGLSPKQLYLVSRFQRAGNDIIYRTKEHELADLAYSNDYYDQMHLTRDFKKYTGLTPFSFLNQNDSIKNLINEKK